MTITELEALVASYMHRGDLTQQIPGFITLAESRISQALRTDENEKAAPVTVTGATTPLPDDYVELSAIEINGRPLERLPAAAFTWRQKGGLRTGGGPLWFSVQGRNFSVTPMAASAAAPTTATLTYWFMLPTLHASSQPTHSVLERWPQLYLYAALIESYWFIAQYQQSSDALQRFVDELNIINTTADSAKWGAAPAAQAG